jgi:hypothetical protein
MAGIVISGVEPSGSATESQLICFLVMSVTDRVLRHLVKVNTTSPLRYIFTLLYLRNATGCF